MLDLILQKDRAQKEKLHAQCGVLPTHPGMSASVFIIIAATSSRMKFVIALAMAGGCAAAIAIVRFQSVFRVAFCSGSCAKARFEPLGCFSLAYAAS